MLFCSPKNEMELLFNCVGVCTGKYSRNREALTATECTRRDWTHMTQSKNIPGSLCDITTESLCGSASASKLRQRQCLCYFQHFLFVCLFYPPQYFPGGTLLFVSTSGQMLTYRSSEMQII